jgi:hypothetical protein
VLYKNQRALLENWSEYEIVDCNEGSSRKRGRSAGSSGSSRTSIVALWLKHDLRRSYGEMVFHPHRAYPYRSDDRSNNKYNLWVGWEHEYDPSFEVDPQRIRRIDYHLKEIVCSGNEELYQYVLRLWKLMLLGKKSGVALCLSGLQGTGKNVMVEYVGQRIVGEQYYACVASLEDLTNKFSSLRCSKCFVVCDELDTWKGDHKTANLLKGLITQGKTKLERKGKDAYLIDDYANLTFLSNYDNFVKVEGKGDRRYCVNTVSAAKKGDVEYFRALNLDMGNEPKHRALTAQEKQDARVIGLHFFHHIMQQDVRDFRPEQIPTTDMRVRMEMDSTPSLCVFVRWFLHEYLRRSGRPTAAEAGAAPQARNAAAKPAEPAKPLRVRATELFTLYEQVLERAGLETQFHMANSLARRLKGDFALFAKGTSRDRSGSYFAAQNEAGLYELAEKLDAQYRFDPTLWAIESDGLQRLQTEAYVGDESEEEAAEGFEAE